MHASPIKHRPWPLPRRPWLVWMSWRTLLFAHWPIEPELVRPHLPPGLELQTWDGAAWIGVVPFDMIIQARGLPALGRQSRFLELNVRTYVEAEGKPGVWFFSLDAERWLAVRAARRAFHLPYFDARMSLTRDGEAVAYASERTHHGAPSSVWRGRYRPTSEVERAEPGTLEHWLTERYCLYASDGYQLFRSDVHHAPWPLQRAALTVGANTLGDWLHFPLEGPPALAHFSDRIDVVGWLPERVRVGNTGYTKGIGHPGRLGTR